MATVTELVLSLFPGIGLLDRGFEDAGFAVVRGPDKIWGGDVHKFHAPPGVFAGVIGGPPCQKFSTANRQRNAVPSPDDLREVYAFFRVVQESDANWALMENVPGSPEFPASVIGRGFAVQRLILDASHVGSEQHRLRKFHFFHRASVPPLVIPRSFVCDAPEPACLASEARRAGKRSWARFCELQGLPAGFDLEPFTVAAKYRAVGNGVPYPLALTLAQAIAERRHVTPQRMCACGCGQYVTGKEITAGPACRKRMERDRKRDTAGIKPARQFNLVLQHEMPLKV